MLTYLKVIMITVVVMGNIVMAGSKPIDKLNMQELFNRALVADGDLAKLFSVFQKAQKGEKLVIGVLGGSITRGAACDGPAQAYHGVVMKWLRAHFPKATFKLVNAGIGATASDYGALRVQRDLLSQKPDLVILEYAVNDKNTKYYAESYEGVVRQILTSPKHPALIQLFMMWKNGKNAQGYQEKIGKHYNLPMISYRDALWPEISSGKLKWKELSPDQVHPNNSGHMIAGKLISLFLDRAFKEYSSNKRINNPQITSSVIPKPYISGKYVNCGIKENEDLVPVKNSGWHYSPDLKGAPAGWVCQTPGKTIEFEVSGNELYLHYWKYPRNMGCVSVIVDGKKVTELDGLFNETWGGKKFLVSLGDNYGSGTHHIKIELLQKKNPRSSGNSFRILGVGWRSAQKLK